VLWLDAAGVELGEDFGSFVQDAVYQAKITLRVKEGYTFDPTMSFTYYPEGVVEKQPGPNFSAEVRELTVVRYRSAELPLLLSEELDLTPYISAPITGASPVTSFFAGNYGGTAAWTKTGDKELVAGLFQAETAYTAAVRLYPGAGYVFPENGVEVVHDRAQAGPVMFTGDSGAVSGDLTFGKTGTAVKVNDRSLTEKVPAPVPGKTPVTSFNAPQYDGVVEWGPSNAFLSQDTFQDGQPYEATVTLTAKEGWTFAGMDKSADAFIHTGAETVNNGDWAVTETGTTIDVTIVFRPFVFNSLKTSIVRFSDGKDLSSPVSAIDLIKDAKVMGYSLVELTLTPQTESETVNLGDDTQDIYGGLILNSTTNNSPAWVIIDGGGGMVRLGGLDPNYYNGSVITVGAGVTLTLRNITFKGKVNNAALIRVIDGGHLILEDGAVITGNTHTKKFDNNTEASLNEYKSKENVYSEDTYFGGGGVVVHGEGSKLTMAGGTISGNTANHGGGVLVYKGGSFTMTGGVIKENNAYRGGGVFLVEGSSLVMSGDAKISGNIVGEGISSAYGGGVCLVGSSRFTMNGGVISGNKALPVEMYESLGGGVYIQDAEYQVIKGTIYGSSATGTDKDGKDLKNTADQGAAVFGPGDSGIDDTISQ
jgi:hypothetical protein